MQENQIHWVLSLRWYNQQKYYVHRLRYEPPVQKPENLNLNIKSDLSIQLNDIWDPSIHVKDISYWIVEWKNSNSIHSPQLYFELAYKLYERYKILKPMINKKHILHIYMDHEFNMIGQYIQWDSNLK